MNFFFKLKHYVRPYIFPSAFFYNKANLSKEEALSEFYPVQGYSANIQTDKWTFDGSGIPLGLYNGSWEGDLAKRVHISGLCECFFGFGELDRVEDQFLIIDFIVDNLNEGESIDPEFKYHYWKTFISEESDDYFVHGMGQGQILSVLTRAKLLGYPKSVDYYINGVTSSFRLPITHVNGFVTDDLEHVILQEYPHLLASFPSVLNGWLYGLIGMNDVIKAGYSDPQFEDLYIASLSTLKKQLPSYDVGFWSLYNQPRNLFNICSAHYQCQHIVLLFALGMLEDDDILLEYSGRFRRQQNSFICRALALITKLSANVWKYKRLYKFK